jgi:hypothetical protein
MRVNIRRKPWSVPRLRGRGEQGIIVMESLSLHTPKSAVKRGVSLTVGLAYHGLASEARSTGGAPRGRPAAASGQAAKDTKKR